MIPQVLFQTWKTHDVPPPLEALRDTFRHHHPTWTMVLFDDRENRQFVALYYPEWLSLYDSLPYNIQRVDMIRYLWMYHVGGVYMDLDMETLRPLPDFLNRYTSLSDTSLVLLGEENQQHHDGTSRVGNAILISTPHHPFWMAVIAEINTRMKQTNNSNNGDVRSAWSTTGPHMLHDVFQNYTDRGGNNRVRSVPPVVFYPRLWEARPSLRPFGADAYPDSWTVHHWACSWWDPDNTTSSAKNKHNLWIALALIGLAVVVSLYAAKH